MFVNAYIDRKTLSRRQHRRIVRLGGGFGVLVIVLGLAVSAGGVIEQVPSPPALTAADALPPGESLPLVTFSVVPVR